MSNWLRASTLLFLLGLGGCSWFTWLPWVDGEDDTDPLEPAELLDFDEEVRVERLWSKNVGDGLGRKYLRLKPLVLADRVYAADGYGTIIAFDRFSGKRVWENVVDPIEEGFLSGFNFFDRRDPSFVSGGLGSGEGYVLLGTTSGYVVALDASNGQEAWRADVGSEVLSQPVTGEGLVYVQTIDGRLLALEADDGEQRWSFDNQVPVLTLRGTSSPVYSSGIVYAGFASGKISAVRANNGEPVWEHRIMIPEGRSELDRIVDVDGTPLITSGVAYASAFQGKVKALRQRDGTPLWERDISSYLDLEEGYGQLYIVADDDVITAIDQGDAEVVWTQEGFSRRRLSPPLAYSNYLMFGDEEGYLHVIAQSDGRPMGRRKTDGDGLRSGMAVADGTLYVLSNSGKLGAYEIKAR